jgi:hypothetical protein
MAPPLNRTWFDTLIDDDGSGTTGTVWNKTQVDGLLDTVDASLAGLVANPSTPGSAVVPNLNADMVDGRHENEFALLAGRPNIQTINGGTASNGILVLQSTAHATRGYIQATDLLYVPGNIKWNPTFTPSLDSNTLDDYREGLWTPFLTGSGGGSGQTYANQLGRYVKIGRLVVATFWINLSVKGTLTGTLRIGGLPFAGAGGAYAFDLGTPLFFANLATAWISMQGLIAGATAMDLYGLTGAATSFTNPTAADVLNNTQFRGTVTYLTD